MLQSKGKKEMKASHTDTLIGEGSIVEGQIKSQASLRIEGKVIGDIICQGDVTIGEKGMAESNIIARNIINAGHIQGAVQTKGNLHITHTGKLIGNLTAGSLVIAQGGIFQGNSRMELKSIQNIKSGSSQEESGSDQRNMQQASANR
ncbi:bactofilin family protein [Marinicrinis sediminis]|uniref:Polymer-forming cytoskeletal protein n=1 Tax=Marinicrinis sediminis TaxID=1652465 RepID=A0ABW5R759_9BACL